MKLLPDISFSQYNNVEFVLNYLKDNPEIGNEQTEPIQYFHCFWKGIVSDLHLMSLDSLRKVHPDSTVIFWTVNSFEIQSSYSWLKIKKLFKDKIILKEAKVEDFKEAGMEIFYPQFSINANAQYTKLYNHDLAYASDILRFMALYLYGGVWFDIDVLFLRNLDSIKLNRYVSQWGTDACGNAAILKLEKGHDLVKPMSKFQRPFYPTYSFKLENDIDLTILPSTFFDILWQPLDPYMDKLQFKSLDDFFKLEKFDLPKEIYAYHWHNRWSKGVPPFFKRMV